MNVIKEPNPLLRQVSLPVVEVDDVVKQFMHSMLETMYHERGIGIAAIQVGSPIRAFIVDMPIQEINESGKSVLVNIPYYIINPKITSLSDEIVILSEGCLSVRMPDGIEYVRGNVARPISITISYTNLNGELVELAVDGTKSHRDLWLARAIQHEFDHLDGILFIDKLCEPILHEIVEATEEIQKS